MASRGLGSGYTLETMPVRYNDTLDVGMRETEDLRMSPKILASHWNEKRVKTVG